MRNDNNPERTGGGYRKSLKIAVILLAIIEAIALIPFAINLVSR